MVAAFAATPRISTDGEDATRRFAAALAPLLAPGDTVALWGDLGAGKSVFARAVIQTRQAETGTPEAVPSPTFTLVQTYTAGDVELWHADLYRLSAPEEIDELGLQDAFETAICLIEWPDRIADELPDATLHLTLTQGAAADARSLALHWSDPSWGPRLAPLLRPRAVSHG